MTNKFTRFEFCNVCALDSLKVAKERFPFFRLKVEPICFDFTSFVREQTYR